jgi:transposase
MTMPDIGPVTALAFIAALDDVTRFGRPGQVTSYLGLVPREYSSGDRQYRGRTLRSAHPYVQSLLVQAAARLLRSRDPRTTALRTWAAGVVRRRGKKVATVALARRIARILFAMWRDETTFAPPAAPASVAPAAGGPWRGSV